MLVEAESVRPNTYPRGQEGFASQPYRLFGSLRFFLAFLVLTYHATKIATLYIEPLYLGLVGLFMFFVLSGFVVCEALDLFYKNSISKFLLNRFLKIFPAYWASLAIAILVLYAISSPQIDKLGVEAIFKNMSLVGFYFYPPTAASVLVLHVSWAMIVEITFYFSAALAFGLARALSNTYAAFVVLSTVGLFGYLLCFLTGSDDRFFSYLLYAPYFVFGAALYFLLGTAEHRAFTLSVAAVAVAFSIHAYTMYCLSFPSAHVVGSTLVFTLTLAIFVYCSGVLCRRNGIRKVDQRLGAVTYALYLIHIPVLHVAVHFKFVGLYGYAFVVLASVAAAFLLEMIIERPLLGMRNRIRGARL